MHLQVLPAFLLVAFLIGFASATPVQSCSGGPHAQADNYNIVGCENTPCRLRRKNDVNLEFKFVPTEEVRTLKNNVHAKIAGVPFPFIGVDGTNACNQIYLPDGTKATCPLKAGQEYLYKNSFKVLEAYPKLKLVVHWALTAQGNKDVICFNVPAKITS